MSRLGTERLEIPNGGVYSVILRQNNTATLLPWVRHDVVAPSSLNVFWQIPQYFVITTAEVLFSVSGIAFAYSQVRKSNQFHPLVIGMRTGIYRYMKSKIYVEAYSKRETVLI